MKPYTRRNRFRYNYVDHKMCRHKHLVNWWEYELGDTHKSKTTVRRKAKEEILKEIDENKRYKENTIKNLK